MTRIMTPEKVVQWPPKVLSTTALGYVRDASGNWIPRDIGRSSVLSNGQILFQFGDAFFHNLKKEFLNVSNNTCAIVQQDHHILNPTVTKYLTQYGPNNQAVLFDGQAPATNLIEKQKDEENTSTTRWKIWAFSGILEKLTDRAHNEVMGWTFFEMWKDNLDGGPIDVYQYTGIAQVSCSQSHSKISISAIPCGPNRALFHIDEPRFGTFCILSDEDYIYAYGHRGNSSVDNQKDVVLARAPLLFAHDRNSYLYWNGKDFVPHLQTLGNVLTDMQHGQIFKTTMFGVNSVFKYAFIGCNGQGDSKAQMGRATAPQGPWEVFELKDLELYALNKGEDKGVFDFRYCVYPHPWGGDLAGKGDLMISWSEGGMTGQVLASMVRLASD